MFIATSWFYYVLQLTWWWAKTHPMDLIVRMTGFDIAHNVFITFKLINPIYWIGFKYSLKISFAY